MLSERIYVYGYHYHPCGYVEKEFLHTFLDEKGAEGYIDKHKNLFPDRFQKYALWKGDAEQCVV